MEKPKKSRVESKIEKIRVVVDLNKAKPKLDFDPEFGVLTSSLIDQLKAAGVRFNDRDEFLAQFQRDADAIVYLTGRGLLTVEQRSEMRLKLKVKIVEYLEKS